MKKVMILIFLIGLIAPMMLFQSAGEATLVFDADLSFQPESGKRFHYWMYNLMYGFETRWGNRNFIGGAIDAYYDDIIHSSGNGIVDAEMEFQGYTAFDFSGLLDVWDDLGGGGPGRTSPGFSTEWPVVIVDGKPVLDPDVFGDGDEDGSQPSDGSASAPKPLQGSGGGGIQPLQGSYSPPAPGGGGGLAGDENFYFTPIFQNNISYTISSSGRLLSVTGLEAIADIVNPTFLEAEGYLDPTRSISVKQVFQVAHFLVLPDYTLHIGETWKAPFWWDLPLVGEPVKIPLTFTLEDIKTFYRFQCAMISFTGLTEIETDIVDENYTRRKESHVEGDIVINGFLFFDLDRGVVVAMKEQYDFGGNEWNQYLNTGGKWFNNNWGFVATLGFDRIDLLTPLTNIIDTRTEKDHVLQDFVWKADIIME